MEKENRSSDVFVFIFFLLVIFILYYPTLNAGAVWDDWFFIFKSQNLKFVNPTEYWGFGNGQRSWPVFFSFLWILDAFFADRFIFYHIVSLLFHASNAFLLYKILPRLGGRNVGIIALLYLVHPLHFFAITWIIQLKTLMCIFFFLLSAMYFLKYTEDNSKENLFFSIVLFILSLLSKSVFAPILILFLFFKKRKIALVFISLCFYALALTFWASYVKTFKDAVLPKELHSISRGAGSMPSMPIVENINHYSKTASMRPLPPQKKKMEYRTSKIVLSVKNFSKYFLYIFNPKENLLIHPTTVVTYSLSDLSISVAVVLFFIFLIFNFIKSKKWISLWGLSFFIVSIFPLSGMFYWSIFTYSNFIEYWLCVPVLGLIICLSQEKLKFSVVVLVAFATIYYGAKTFESARIYTSSDAMILKSIERSPENVYLKLVLANHYFFTKRFELSNTVLNKIEHELSCKAGVERLRLFNDKGFRGEYFEEISF